MQRSFIRALVKEALVQHSTTPSLIPSGTTGPIQVADACDNRPFKAIQKDAMDVIIDSFGKIRFSGSMTHQSPQLVGEGS